MAGLRVLVLVVLAGALQAVGAALPPPERSYNILMLLPVSSKSHRNVFMPLAKALTQRGHKITMLSNQPAPDNNPNIRYIENPSKHVDTDKVNAFEILGSPEKMFKTFTELIPKVAQEIYKVAEVADLYEKRREFDLIVIDALFNEVMYPFTHNHTFMTINPGELHPSFSASMGNFLNPAYVSNMLENYQHPFSLLDRWKNLIMSVILPFHWERAIVTPVQAEISKQFPDLPRLDDLKRNQSLTLINSHFSVGQPLPLLPNQVEVGGLHIGPPAALPKDLSDFLSGTTPVVYMSLGSIARSSAMPQEYKDIFFSAFAKLPYKVLWKFEEKPPKKAKNLFVQTHPNVKVFISHCGWLGSQESLYFGTPILGLPIFGDQPKNALALEHAGVARSLAWADLNEQRLMDSITELIENPKYREKAEKISAAMKDRPLSAVETAVYWTEYVIRHQGAVHLRSPERDLTWVQLLHLDLLLLLHVALYLVYLIISKLLAFFCGGSRSKAKRMKGKRD
ncbi:hypothetical protein HAZT_HAZT005992 [Hyalella azteca]|uniref:UDP-glucuronosyltransferase n=1 Tax=Hyalella azteca TaxID=294128 RepID=A0A6A0GQC2_HYAAZ|nr:hypothetical protein HAZT_HAZT005992 [Hyalella azteca]